MPKSTRDLLKRQVAQSVHHIEEAQMDLLDLREKFLAAHPAEADLLELIVKSLEVSITFVSDFCMQAWGTCPPDWNSWRNPGHKTTEDEGDDAQP